MIPSAPKYSGCQLHALAALGDSGAQKQRSQVLFHCARTDVETSGDFLVTAPLGKEAQHLFVPRGYLDGI
jgi:hypothetical protein